MRILHACAYVATTALAVACGGSDGAKPDAPPIVVPDAPAPDAFVPPQPDAQTFDFSCMGNAAPTTAPATVSITGTASDLNIGSMALEPVADATVKAFKNGTPDLQIGTTTSDANGDWNLPTVPTATMPVDGFVEATKTGHRTVRLYPPAPINADIPQAPVLLLADGTFSTIVAFTGKPQSDANGTVGLAVVDCANTPIGGATVSVTHNGVQVDPANTFDASQLQPGAFFVFDVPPGDSVVNATFQGMTLRAHTITVLAKTTSTTIIRPGF
jgi:hypothetical protein